MRNLVTGYIEETRTQMKERQKKGELAPTYQYYAVPSDKCRTEILRRLKK